MRSHRQFHSTNVSATPRRGVVLVLAAIMLVVVFGFVAFTVDIGYMNIVKSELQNAADAAALAAAYDLPDGLAAVQATAKSVALENNAAGSPVIVENADIELGLFNFLDKTFTPGGANVNAVRVTTRVNDQPFFFAPVLGNHEFDMTASAIGMLNPRDIVFVVDTSGSMNDDTEPVWATDTINNEYGPLGYPNVATPLMEDLFQDFGFGAFPGTSQYIGQPLGVASDYYALPEMTKDDGPLADAALDAWYRILPTDDEHVRREKAWRWIIDHQIAVIMPNAMPTPDSTVNFEYWATYLDYIIAGSWVGEPPPPPPPGGGGTGTTPPPTPTDPPPPTPPIGNYKPVDGVSVEEFLSNTYSVQNLFSETEAENPADTLVAYTFTGPGVPRRGSTEYIWVPWGQDGDRIYHFNNPNYFTFPSADWSGPYNWQNKIGYFTYVQFMMDWGRDRSPNVDNGTNADPALDIKTPLSLLSGMCPMHTESTAGGSFSFPPREQPMHATRRALIAALQVVVEQNSGLSTGAGDRVAVVSFDGLDAYHTPELVLSLTSEHTVAMQACTTLQSVSDIGSTTAIEAGLLLARNHLKNVDEGGAGRDFANKVVVLLTDGVPNAWASSDTSIENYMIDNPSGEFYHPDYVWYNSALMQAAMMEGEETKVFCVGVGLGADYDFMDRMARLSGTDEGGMSPRGSGNPAVYEQRMTEIFTEIIKAPGSRLVN